MKRRPFILVITTLSIAGGAMVSVVASKNHTIAVNETTNAPHVALPDNLKKLPIEQLLPLPGVELELQRDLNQTDEAVRFARLVTTPLTWRVLLIASS